VGAIAIILARSGSRGVPGKNWAIVAGKPCVAWTIDAAQGAESVDRVVVSTDAPEAASIARDMGAEVHDRPRAVASDTATVDDAARSALLWADPEAAISEVVILYANVPVRPDKLIDRAVRLLRESGCDSVQSYGPVGKHHPWWTVRVDEEGGVRPWQGDVLYHGVYRRQDLPPAFVPDGGVVVVTRKALLGGAEKGGGPHAFLGSRRRGVMTGEGEVVDIDSRLDLIVADAVLRSRVESEDVQVV